MADTRKASETQLIFKSSVGRQKPRTLHLSNPVNCDCPFCDRSQLPPVLKEDGNILLVPNKYPIHIGSQPLVLIETDQCDSELSLYSESHLFRVFHMALDTWKEMIESGDYASVLFLKNHGPYSGGSLRHPHMQLIGLKEVDYRRNITHRDFEGPVIWSAPGVRLNLSDHPRIGFYEFNVQLTLRSQWQEMCRLIQKTVQFLLRDYQNGRIDSYNFFFYDLDGIIYCKIMPRLVTTPLFMGYSIPQVCDNLDVIVHQFQSIYFPNLALVKEAMPS
ncbi:MAG TPA: DUF4931 domain-containing protein [Peptococcaceae bacterium]|nr:DUF4931 domain-containing protein [Peptococcaceae bacterium]